MALLTDSIDTAASFLLSRISENSPLSRFGKSESRLNARWSREIDNDPRVTRGGEGCLELTSLVEELLRLSRARINRHRGRYIIHCIFSVVPRARASR